MSSDADRDLLRHTLATLAYRGGKAVRNAPETFPAFQIAAGSRTPGQILAHVSDVLDWGLSIASGKQAWRDSKTMAWPQEVERFFSAITAFDKFLGSGDSLHAPAAKLFQGPIADALTHVGQLSMLRRLSGSPLKGENYFVAEIAAGRVGADQAAPHKEFD